MASIRRSVLTTCPASRARSEVRARMRAPLKVTATPLSSVASSGPRTRTCTSGDRQGGRPGWRRRGGRPAVGWGRCPGPARPQLRPTTRRGRRWRWCHSWDFHLTDLGGSGPLGHVPGQLGERLVFAGRIHLPPDGVATGRAGGDGRLVAQGAVESSPGGEGDRAFFLLVAVVEQV